MYRIVNYLCKRRGITIAKMCSETGIAKSSISELKSGRTKNLSPAKCAKIAEYFGVSVDYVLGLTPESHLIELEGEFAEVSGELDGDPDNFELQCRYDALKEQVEDAKLALNLAENKKEPGVVNNSELKEEAFKIAKEIIEIPEMEALFHAARGNSTNNILAVAEMLQKFKDASGR